MQPGPAPKLVTTLEAVEAMAEKLRRVEYVGIDTEFIRETTFFPRIALVQVATADEAWLVDPLAFEKDDRKNLAPLLEVLADKRILKIMHAAFADQECLFWAYGRIAEPVLDTAIAAALCGYGDNVGLGKLLKEVLDVNIAKGRARVKWLQRPLSRELLQYAEQDVTHLVDLGKVLMEKLRRKNRFEWAMRESFVPESAFDVSPEDMATRMAKSGTMDSQTYNVLVEVLRWREDRARTANLPRAWVAGNEVLISLAKVRPTTLEDLRSFRGLNAKEIDRQGERILAAIERGKAAPKVPLDLPERQPAPTENEDHGLDLIKAYIAYLAATHGVAPRFLLNTGRGLQLLRGAGKPMEDWVKGEILSSSALGLIGDDLKALLDGKRAMVLRGGKVEILPL